MFWHQGVHSCIKQSDLIIISNMWKCQKYIIVWFIRWICALKSIKLFIYKVLVIKIVCIKVVVSRVKIRLALKWLYLIHGAESFLRS